MAIRSDEIISIIKSAIDQFDAGAETRSVGTVVEVGDGIAQVYGLAGALASELLEFPGGVMGMALNLEEETVGAVILGDATGDQGRRHGQDDRPRRRGPGRRRRSSAAWSTRSAARSTTRARSPRQKTRPVERIAPGVIVRQGVDTPVQTGIKAIDALIPIGRGQRELIIGDRQTGKTADRHRHDHQPEGQGPRLHLRGHRPEALDRRQDRGHARAVRRDGAHDRRRRRRRGSRPAPVPRPVRRRGDGRGDHGDRRRDRRPDASRTRCASTTT